MKNKIFVFFIAGILLISMLAFAIAQNETPNLSERDQINAIRENMSELRQKYNNYTEQMQERINETRQIQYQMNETRSQIKPLKENISETRQNIAEIRQNWTNYKSQVKQQIKNQRMTFVGCVSDSAKIKNDCLNASNGIAAACKISSINNSDNNATKQCLSEYKDARAECMNGFKGTRTECNQAKHNFFDSLRVMFK